MKDCETKTGLSLLPSLQSFFQSAPAVWTIKLSEIKTSILLEVLKVQSEKKPVKLMVCSHEESEVKSFLQFLPYISQLRFDRWSSDLHEQTRFLVSLFCAAAERDQQTGEKMLEMLASNKSFLVNLLSAAAERDQQTGEKMLEMHQFYCQRSDLHEETRFIVNLFCAAAERDQQTGEKMLEMLASLSEIKTSILLEVLKLQSEKKPVKLKVCSHEESEVRSFLQCLPYISELRLSNNVALFLSQWVRRGRVACPLVVEELSVVSTKAPPSQRVLLKVGSSLASLLRFWTVGRLDLTESGLPAQSLLSLLLHDAPLTVSLIFLQQPLVPLTKLRVAVDPLSAFRPSPSFVRTSIREIYRGHSSHMIPSLLRSLDHVINLSCTELDSEDCAALIFILRHSDGVRLKLLWSSIPAEGIQSILRMLHTVSDLSVDRNQLLSFIHCCAASDSQQEAASSLLRTLQHSLDLSCSSCVELPEEDQAEPLRVTAADCRAVSTILRHSSRDTQLHLRDCEVEDSGLDLLFPVLDRVRLRVSKTVLVQLLTLLAVDSETDTVRRAVSLFRALGEELDLSHITLDQRLCGALVLMLDNSEGLTELDLSHCQLTDQLLLQLITHLHKVQVLE
ncbi:hypothetical protein GOODEAATRI_022289 [Goodea atripinnis]|uniref:Uncharacterized protein n=1 Tax=Goodea atripinnis TaxID=208336 RepID=A0ABV0PR05_9TELE